MGESTTKIYLWVLRLTAGMFVLLQVFITSSAAISARPAILSMQRSLVDYSERGGVSIDHLADPLLGLFLITYLSALASLLITLGFSWYAGRIAMESTGQVPAASRAGMSVALTSGLVWFIIGVPAILLTQADGTVSWLVATTGVIVASQSGPPTSSVYVISPGVPYLIIQSLALLLQMALFLAFALSSAAIAGRLGAGSVQAQPTHFQ
jgi:hypothetical protein